MEIIVGKLAGFCGGVINSVTKATEYLDKYDKLYCLGELVHNKQVVDKLESKGLSFIEELSEVPDKSTVVIRAHGVPVSVYDEALRREIELLDLTCPNVLKIHEEAKRLRDNGYFVILIAQKNHPEAIGTISFCGDNSFIVESEDDIEDAAKLIYDLEISEVAVISQTTFSVAKFNYFVETISNKLSDLEILINNTICSATELRQKETKEMAKSVDAMIIIGGKNSSNTKKLYELSLKECSNTFIVETLSDLNSDMSVYSKVGVMAGASTPKESISEIVEYLKKC